MLECWDLSLGPELAYMLRGLTGGIALNTMVKIARKRGNSS